VDSYIIGFSNLPNGYTRTQVIGAINDSLNSDINADSKTNLISLNSGSYNPNIDAGFYLGIPLGVADLKAINAILISNTQSKVNWYTTDEVNTKNFEIRRSINGIDYQTIGTSLASTKTSGKTNYSFVDNIENLIEGSTLFYQIKLNDLDGGYTLSNIINVKLNRSNGDISIYPIPFSDNITINYPSGEVSEIYLELTDVSGRVIKSINSELKSGNNTILLEQLSNIAPGTYFLRIVNLTTGIHYVQKIVK